MKDIFKLYLLTVFIVFTQVINIWGANEGIIDKTSFFILEAIIMGMVIAVVRGFYHVYKYRQYKRQMKSDLHRIYCRLNKVRLNKLYGNLSGRWINKVDGNNRLIHIYEQRRVKD